ncbi:MAG TPA: IS66 family transposase [Allosphingosinicella sp.]|nr:IS66 family transposase [Allosphingosinicella sp.]
MRLRFDRSLIDYELADLLAMPAEEVVALAWRQREALRSLANRLGEDSTTSSRPPSSDDPYRREERGRPAPDGAAAPPGKAGEPNEKKPGRPPGRQPGSKGFWRAMPIVTSAEARHAPIVCAACEAELGPDLKRRGVSAHNSLELARRGMSLEVTATKHVYFAVRCSCGRDNVERPRVGLRSDVEGRRRNLLMSERCLVGPMLAAFIAALSLRFRMSREKIREFLRSWLGLQLGAATIERCIHEFGLASEPIVEQLVQDVRAADIVHIDETPWHQGRGLRWMWVATTAMTAVFRIASRRKEELTALIGDAFLGWLVTDGYLAYRDHRRRQRCLAHLIRKGLALAEGWYDGGSGFGRDLVRDLRRLIERVHDGEGGEAPAVKRLMARIRWSCQKNRHEAENKVRELAGEILNDWDAVVAFVHDPRLPPTNNDAERALRHAVIARRISFGTRTDEGSRFYAAALSVIETCRRRTVDPWAYACGLIAAARASLPLPAIPGPLAIPPRAVA